MKDQLIKKLHSKSAVIGVIGLGYVGLPLALRYAQVGYKVIGFDIDPEKTEKINSGESYISHISDATIQDAVNKKLKATSNYSNARNSDALIMCLPTPLDKHREPDLSYIINTLEALIPYISKRQVVSLESTTYPGTTDEVLRPRLAATGLEVGKDIFLVYSPEREDPGNPDFTTNTIPKICSGITPACLEVGMALYEQVIDQLVPVSSTRTAEMTKLLENIHRAVNIGLVNEMKVVADRMGINIHEVIDAAATKPFGFVPYYPGPGLGGHCIPIDPFYLTWKAREFGINPRLVELAGEVNSRMPQWVVKKITDGLNSKKKSINGSRILVLGIAYKKNVDDMRESPAVEIMRLLQEKGAVIGYSDPFVPVFPKMRRYNFELSSEELTHKTLNYYDCAVIVADHDGIDYKLISDSGILIVDTRGVYRSHADNIICA